MTHYGKITGWGTYIPEKVVTNADLEKLTDTSDEWIVQRTGIRERRFAATGETTASMACAAGQAALSQAEVDPSALDLIIVATSTPDYLAPAVSSEVQERLGAADVPAFTLMTGCTGFVYALSTAYQFIQTGAYERILIIGVEFLSPYMDMDDRATAVLFGDAAGAVVLVRSAEPCGLKGFILGSDGNGGPKLAFPTKPNGACLRLGLEKVEGSYIRFNGSEVFKFAVRALVRSSYEALAKADMTFDDIDWIVPHQANLRIVQMAAREMGLPLERFYLNIEKYGNTSAASIPVALAEGLDAGVIKPYDRVLLTAFGAGLTWGAAVFELAPRPQSQAVVEMSTAAFTTATD